MTNSHSLFSLYSQRVRADCAFQPFKPGLEFGIVGLKCLHLFFKPSSPLLQSDDSSVYVGRGKKPKGNIEGYSPQQLQALRLCNFLLQTGDKEVIRALVTVLKSLLAVSERKRVK